MHQRRSDTPEFTRIIEADFAKARAELAALSCAVSALSMENANLKHQNYAQGQELSTLRKLHATVLENAIERGMNAANEELITATRI